MMVIFSQIFNVYLIFLTLYPFFRKIFGKRVTSGSKPIGDFRSSASVPSPNLNNLYEEGDVISNLILSNLENKRQVMGGNRTHVNPMHRLVKKFNLKFRV